MDDQIKPKSKLRTVRRNLKKERMGNTTPSRSSKPLDDMKNEYSGSKRGEIPQKVEKVNFGTFNTNKPLTNVLVTSYDCRFEVLYKGRAKASNDTRAEHERLEFLLREHDRIECEIRSQLSKVLLCMRNDADSQKINLWY
jgi:hypothetical protein